ncbi:MAG: DUF423 domain-containing protein [Parvibaculaceae bacterium]|nr:DUF423 domain-containing protein [Parvibaculaceae bacterium]
MRFWLFIAAANGFLAVALGAFAAHGLSGKVPDTDLAIFETGARYHMYHALALVIVAWLTSQTSSGLAQSAGWAFLLGIVLFSGSLYFLGITGSRALVLATPLGGVAFLAGWALIALSALRLPPSP